MPEKTRRANRYKLFVPAVSVVSILLATACGNTTESGNASTNDTITFGVIAPLTGAGATYGEPQAYAMKVLAEQVNEEGGLEVGGKKYQIKVVMDDPKGDPSATKQIINKQLTKDKINFSITNGDPIDPIAAPVTEQNNIIMLDNTANKTFYSPPYKYILNGYATPDWAALPFYKTLAKLEPQIKTVHFVGIDAQFDHNHLDWEEAAANEVGWQSKGKTFYPGDTVDFASVLTPVVTSKPDMISIGVPSGNTPSIVKTLRQLGYKGVISSPIPLSDMTQMIKGAGKDMDSYYQADDVSYPLTPEYLDFEKRYTASGVTASTTAAGYWIFFRMFLNGLQEAGTITDADKIVEVMAKQSLKDAFIDGSPEAHMGGKTRYGQIRQLVLPLVVNQVVDGKIVTRATQIDPGSL